MWQEGYQDNEFKPTVENLANAAEARWGDEPKREDWEVCGIETFMKHLRKCEQSKGITWDGKPDPYCVKTRGKLCYE